MDGGGCDENDGDRLTVLFAMLMKDGTMTRREIVSRSMPFLNTVCAQMNRIRMIEAGINPDKKERSPASSYGYDEEESELSDEEFYGRINELLK